MRPLPFKSQQAKAELWSIQYFKTGTFFRLCEFTHIISFAGFKNGCVMSLNRSAFSIAFIPQFTKCFLYDPKRWGNGGLGERFKRKKVKR